MKKPTCAIVLFIILSASSFAAPTKSKVAVCPIMPSMEQDGQRTNRAEIVEKWNQLTDGIIDAIKAENCYTIVDSKKVGKKMKSLDLTVNGIEDIENLCMLGKALSADYIIHTEVSSTKVLDYHLYSAYNNDKLTGWHFTIAMINVATKEYEWIGVDETPIELPSVLHNIVYRQMHPGEEPKRDIGVPRYGNPVAAKDGLVGLWDFDLGEMLDLTDNDRILGGNNIAMTTSTLSGYGYAATRKKMYDFNNYLSLNDPLLLKQANWSVCMWVQLPEMPEDKELYNIKIITEQSEKYDKASLSTNNYKGYEITMVRNIDPKGENECGFRIESDVVTSVSGGVVNSQETKGCKQFFPLPSEMFSGGWHHMTLVKELDGDDVIYIYLDGNLVVKYDTGYIREYSGQTFFGWHAEAIDNLRIYDRVISVSEVQEIFYSEKNQSLTN